MGVHRMKPLLAIAMSIVCWHPINITAGGSRVATVAAVVIVVVVVRVKVYNEHGQLTAEKEKSKYISLSGEEERVIVIRKKSHKYREQHSIHSASVPFRCELKSQNWWTDKTKELKI